MEILDNKPLIQWIIDTTEDLFDERVVVTRNSEVRALCEQLNVKCVIHELPNRNDTVRLGLSELKKNVDYCFFTPGDQPLIRKESIIKLISVAKENKDTIVRACYSDTVGSPMGFPFIFFEELLKLPEGKGGNWVAKNNPDLVKTIEVQDEYELWDIDTTSDLEKINNVLKIK